MTRRVKVACATITPSGSEVRKGNGAAPRIPVKAGNSVPRAEERALQRIDRDFVAEVARGVRRHGVSDLCGRGGSGQRGHVLIPDKPAGMESENGVRLWGLACEEGTRG